jgi:hypothetical protein
MLYTWNLGGFGPCNGQTLTACQTLTTACEKQSLNNCLRERQTLTTAREKENQVWREKELYVRPQERV